MIPLFTCKSCGLLSTFAGAYTRRSGVRFCNSCAEGYDADLPPTSVWCREAIDAALASERKP